MSLGTTSRIVNNRPVGQTAQVSTVAQTSLVEQTSLGVIVPYDMALDRELWRWVPVDVTLLFTRTPYLPMEVTLAMAECVSDASQLAAAVVNLSAVSPAAYAYGCTSASFVHGRSGEQVLVQAMRDAGAPEAVTASGALSEALQVLGAHRVVVVTPYTPDLTASLSSFLTEHGLAVVGGDQLGLTRNVWEVPYVRTEELVRRADRVEADAIVIACTNLHTYDLIGPLERELGKPVVSANQALIWAALRRLDRRPIGPGQRLVEL